MMKHLLAIFLSLNLPIVSVARLIGSTRNLQLSTDDFGSHWLGIPFNTSEAQSRCPKEWTNLLTCVSGRCPNFTDVCPDLKVSSSSSTASLADIPTCPQLSSQYCQSLAGDDCCLRDCKRFFYAVPLCYIRRTTIENRDDCTPPKSCDLLQETTTTTTTTTSTSTTSSSSSSTIEIPIANNGQCFGTPILTGGTLGLGLAVQRTCEDQSTPSACTSINGCQWSAAGIEPDCYSSDECEEGYFCSVFGNGTQSCQELTCANWQLGPPQGEDPSSEIPCESITGNSFCGTDGTCRSYTCQNWYQYGPFNFTGYDTTNPIDLVCEDYGTSSSSEQAIPPPSAVIFACQSHLPEAIVPSDSLAFPFNRQCFAQASNGWNFTCYDMDRNTEYRDFQVQLAKWNEPTCDAAASVDEPIFWYQTVMQQAIVGGDPIVLDRGERNNIFYANLAESVMFAKVVIDETTEESSEGILLDLPDYTLEQLKDPTSPQSQAYEWLSLHPDLDTMAEWRKMQRFALATFYYSFQGDNWPASEKRNYLSYDIAECEWGEEYEYTNDGEDWANVCDDEGSFLEIHLDDIMEATDGVLVGNLPPEIALLTNLTDIKIGHNGLEGLLSDNMPATLVALTSLTEYTFPGNRLGGTIPTELGLLTGLLQLNLYSNELTGTLPSELGMLTNVVWLRLDGNMLSGTIPTEMGLLTNAKRIDLTANLLSGTVPLGWCSFGMGTVDSSVCECPDACHEFSTLARTIERLSPGE